MNRRKFVLTSSVMMLCIAGAVAGLAFYSNFVASASDLPNAINYLPADSQAVFGMNVHKFVTSQFYAKLEAEHGDRIGQDLAEFTAKTGVDPRRDLDYIIAAARSMGSGGDNGVVIAVGRFDKQKIDSYIRSKSVPIDLDYKNAHVQMIPESNGDKLEKGIAYLNDNEIAFGDLQALKEVLDVRYGSAPGIESNAALASLLADVSLNPEEMFWFAGDAGSILSKAPTGTPFGESLSAIQSIFGTLNLDDAVAGRITAMARDEEAAGKLADVAKGFLALGQLAGDQNADLADLVKGINIRVEGKKVEVNVNFPIDLIERLKTSGKHIKNVM